MGRTSLSRRLFDAMANPPSSYTKFGFDTEFFELVQGQKVSAKTAVEAPATPEDLRAQEAAVRQGIYDEGYAAGMEEGQKQAQADLAQLQQHLQNTLLALQKTQDEREEHLLTQMLGLLRVTLHRLVGQVADNYGPELLEHHLRTLLPLLKSDEALTLRIHPAARGFHEKLGLPQASIMGLPMHIASDPTLGQTDAVVMWTNGGVESKLEAHMTAVDDALAGAGAQMLNVEHKANLNVTPAAAPRAAAPAAEAPASDMDTATRAAKARADALLGDEDDLVDALK
ncbi:MAG: hypothetical protein EON60_07145 [Alphaproteobacteria bacterium]|nr:MAG: hypothetical protein EON60_07145 [Alphaproteobacteria bacterium]